MKHTLSLLFVVSTVRNLAILPNTVKVNNFVKTAVLLTQKHQIVLINQPVLTVKQQDIPQHLECVHPISKSKPKYSMKFLQLNISSFNSSIEELWLYQQEHNYDGIYLQETNYTTNKTLGPFQHWKTNMHSNFKDKALGFGVGTIIPKDTKNVFRHDLTNQHLELIWNELEIQGQKVLIGNIYIPPNMESHLYMLDKELEKHQGKKLILLGDFNSRNKVWDKNSKRNTKMGNILEEIINRHSLFIATDVDNTYHHSDKIDDAGKSTIDLTLVRGLPDLHVTTKEFNLIKTRHKAIEITINETVSKGNKKPHLKTKNADWAKWEDKISPELRKFKNTFPSEINPEIIDSQATKLTDIIIKNATEFFGTTKISKKESKGWWNNDIKNTRTNVKIAQNKYKKNGTPENHTALLEVKKQYQTLIETSKLQFYKKQTDFLNQSRDATQFWHRYDKIIGRKRNNVVEPLYDVESSTYVFDDEKISNKLQEHHIFKTNSSSKYDDTFKSNIENKLKTVMSKLVCETDKIFFGEEHIKDAIKNANKHSAPGPDTITADLILNGGKQLVSALTLLLQASYQIGHFPKPWKIENRIYFKKIDKIDYHRENSYRPISLTNLFGKIFERILLQEATNILEEQQFFKGKNLYAYQKNKNTSQAFFL